MLGEVDIAIAEILSQSCDFKPVFRRRRTGYRLETRDGSMDGVVKQQRRTYVRRFSDNVGRFRGISHGCESNRCVHRP